MYGFTITKQGRRLLASLLTGQQLVITGVKVGSGKVPDGQDPRDLTGLVAPFPEPYCWATRTQEIRTNDRVDFTVEYRSDLNGGLDQGRYINEFGVFAQDPEYGNILLYYANLGDYPEWVFAYDETQPPTIRRYPVEIGVSADVTVVIDFQASAFVTSEEVQSVVEQTIRNNPDLMKNLVEETFEELVEEGTCVDRGEVQRMIDDAIAGGGGGRYSGRLELTIPKTGWTAAETPTPDYNYICDVAVEGMTAEKEPIGGLLVDGSQTAGGAAGMADGCQTMDGYVRFFSKGIPDADLQAVVVIFTKGSSGGIATDDTPGAVMPGDGMTVLPDGTLALKLGNGMAINDEGEIVADTVDEDQTEEDLKEILTGGEETPAESEG